MVYKFFDEKSAGSGVTTLKGTLMQIWKSPYIF